jgi:hypothetical protein
MDIQTPDKEPGISILKPGEVLIMRTCTPQMTGYNGFKWPEMGPVEAPDWNPEAVCGKGLHGMLWGCGDGSLLNWNADAKWLVVAVSESSIIDLGGKVKFPRGRVVFSGKREGATSLIQAYGTAGTATAGDRGTATAGDGGTATAGDGGTATAGDSWHRDGWNPWHRDGWNRWHRDGWIWWHRDGWNRWHRDGWNRWHRDGWRQVAPRRLETGGTATAGYGGTATAGTAGTATAGYGGTATAGNSGTATAGTAGTATAGDAGTATAGYAGTATAGYGGTATAGDDGTATAGTVAPRRLEVVVAQGPYSLLYALKSLALSRSNSILAMTQCQVLTWKSWQRLWNHMSSSG